MRVCPECNTRTEKERCPRDGRPTVEEAKLKPKVPDPFVGLGIEGKYQVEERLGRGGMGSVYRARHVETGGNVAVKLLRADLLEDELAVRRFYIEAQNTHRLHHPNTVRVSDFGQTDSGIFFLVMEYLPGVALSKVLERQGRLSAARTVRISEQVLKSLAEAHAQGVVHRDIKPENIMLLDELGEPDFVKVLDFGISRSLEGGGAATKGAIGTPKYMAPEQWGNEQPDHRADLYSVGCIMYEMLAGRPPFVVKGQGTEQTLGYMRAHMYERPVPLLEEAPDACPQPLADLVMALLRKRPEDRPASAEQVFARLSWICKHFPLEDPEITGSVPVIPAFRPPSESPTRAPTPARARPTEISPLKPATPAAEPDARTSAIPADKARANQGYTLVLPDVEPPPLPPPVPVVSEAPARPTQAPPRPAPPAPPKAAPPVTTPARPATAPTVTPTRPVQIAKPTRPPALPPRATAVLPPDPKLARAPTVPPRTPTMPPRPQAVPPQPQANAPRPRTEPPRLQTTPPRPPVTAPSPPAAMPGSEDPPATLVLQLPSTGPGTVPPAPPPSQAPRPSPAPRQTGQVGRHPTEASQPAIRPSAGVRVTGAAQVASQPAPAAAHPEGVVPPPFPAEVDQDDLDTVVLQLSKVGIGKTAPPAPNVPPQVPEARPPEPPSPVLEPARIEVSSPPIVAPKPGRSPGDVADDDSGTHAFTGPVRVDRARERRVLLGIGLAAILAIGGVCILGYLVLSPLPGPTNGVIVPVDDASTGISLKPEDTAGEETRSPGGPDSGTDAPVVMETSMDSGTPAPGDSEAGDPGTPQPARIGLTLRSDPTGADVTDEDGEVIGRTPIVLWSPPIAEGTPVILRVEGHRTARVALRFGSGGAERVESVKLAELPQVEIRSVPAKATVTFKETGVSLGTTPVKWRLSDEAFHTLEEGRDVTLAFKGPRGETAERVLFKSDVMGTAPVVEVKLGPAPSRGPSGKEPGKGSGRKGPGDDLPALRLDR
jgi:serine/threonine-protein kinase